MADVRVEINGRKLFYAIQDAEGLKETLEAEVNRIKSAANANGSGFRTENTVDWATGQRYGGTAPIYDGNVQRKKNSTVGLVFTANYSARKDNMLHNTLLKSI